MISPCDTPIRSLYYGTPLYYRIENRAGVKTLIVSYRDESNLRPKLVCEMPPVGGQKIQPYLTETATTGGELLMSLPAQLMSNILQPWIGLESETSRERRKAAPDLTLGVLLVADYSLLLHYTSNPRATAPSVIEVLPATAYRNLLQCGLEAEELRMLRGQPPQLVSAKHYYDRTNESAINKIGSIQDRWMSSLCPCITTQNRSGTKITAANTPITWVSPLPNHRTQVLITLGIPPSPPESLPETGITLALHSLYGFSGTITQEAYSHDKH